MSRTSPVHYIAPSAISITPNANGSVNDLAVYVARGAKIRVYSPRAGIGYDGNAEYKQWTLTGRNRRLTASQTPYTIYARISKTDTDDGYVVFAQKVLDGDVWKDKYPYVTTDGLAKGTAGRDTGNYWYIRIGDVSVPSEGARTVTLDTGILGTDQYNTDWSVSPDALPLRVEIGCVIDDEDVGQNAYVYWDQVLVMTASLVEGWTGTDAQRFRHWSITRNTGNSDADAAWLLKDYVRAFKTTGSIRLSHIRGSFDDFGGAVSTMFTVTAWGVPEGQDDADESEYVVLAELPVSILAETAEKYELVLTPNIIGYNPTTEEYSPAGGCVVSLRATDQRSDVFDVTFAQFRGAQLAGSYAEVGSSTWVPLTFSGSDDMPAQAVIPVSAFAAQKSLNVRLVNAAAKELDSDTVAFVRDGEDSRDREWIFLRSQEPITFGDASSEHPAPSYIQTGEVNPSGAAGAVTEDKNQEGWVPEGWWDEQQGTDADNPYEYGSYRDYVRATDEEDGHWGDFSMPRIWNHYGEDGILYSILTDADSVSIPTDQTSVTTGFNAVFQRKAGDNTPAAYQCYYAAYRRHGNTYSRFEHSGLTRVSSVVFGNIAVSSDSASQNYCEAIVIYISDSPLSAGALQSAPPDSYLAKKEISVIKDGNTGPSGEDAYGVYVNPGYAIFEETLNSGTPVVDTSGWVGVIQVLKGSAPQPFKLTYGQHSHCRPTSDSTQEDTSVMEATVKFDLLKTQGAYSSEGYLAISVATDDGAYTNTNVKIPYYLSLLDTLKKAAANWFLSKEYDDTAKGNINFEKDVAVGGDFSVAGDAAIDGILMALEQIFTNRIQSDNFNGDGPFDTGFELIKNDGSGYSYLVVDKLFVRLKAIFNELEIRKISYSGGNFIFSHAGSHIVYVKELQLGVESEVEGTVLKLSGAVDVADNVLNVGSGSVSGSTLTLSSDKRVYAYRCYIMKDDGTTATENWWRVDDQARCQTFNVVEPGHYENIENTSYWRRVIAVGHEKVRLNDSEQEQEYDYVDLSLNDCMQGSDIPKAGDQIVQMGNRTDAERQGFISLEVAGEYAPAFKVYKGVNYYTLDGKRKICISPKLTDIRAQKFTIETEYDTRLMPMERGDWSRVAEHKCYYYNLVQHNGATWLCVCPEGEYTTEEPSETATYWRPYAQKGKDGKDGKSFNILGSYDTEAELIAAHPTGSVGDAYMVAGDLYVWDEVNTRWHNSGRIQGDAGRGIASAEIVYGVSENPATLPTEWEASPAELTIGPGDFLFVRTILSYDDGTDAAPYYSISRFGVDGSFKQTAFTRTNKNISSQQLSGKPLPNDFVFDGETIHFSDGIPTGEKRVWATSNIFYGDGTQSGWTPLTPMTDTSTFDVEFSPNETKPADPSDNESQRDAQGWYDPTRNPSHDFSTTIWRAERQKKNGEWGAWAIEKVKGEKGEKGDDGADSVTTSLSTQTVEIPTDTDGICLEDTQVELSARLFVGSNEVKVTDIVVDEQSSQRVTSVVKSTLDMMPWATSADASVQGNVITFSRNASVQGAVLTIGGDAFNVTPSKVVVTIAKGTVVDEHTVSLRVTGVDEDKTTHYGFAAFNVQRHYIPVDGQDAINIIVTPASLIVNQSLQDPSNLGSLSEEIIFSATMGERQVAVNKVEVTSTDHCTVEGSNGNKATVRAIGTYTEEGSNYYYDKANFICKVTTAYGTIEGIKVDVYANLLGTWKETVEADTKTEVARSLTYGYDPESGEVISLENFGSFIKSSEENISTISRQINDPTTGLVTQISTIDQKADRISLIVESKENTNLVSDPDIYQMLTSAITRNIRLVKDRKYTLTARLKNTSSTATSCTIDIASLTTLPCSLAAGAVDNFSKTFTAPATGTFILTVPQTANVLLEWLQVEQGSAFTKHDNIGSAFQRTGIDIENGLIKATTDNFVICNSSGTQTFSVDSDGNLVSSGSAKFSGTIEAKGGTIGGFVIGTSNIHSAAEDSSHNPLIQLNNDGSARIGGLVVANNGDATLTGTINATGGNISGNLTVGEVAAHRYHFEFKPKEAAGGTGSYSYYSAQLIGYSDNSATSKEEIFSIKMGEFVEVDYQTLGWEPTIRLLTSYINPYRFYFERTINNKTYAIYNELHEKNSSLKTSAWRDGSLVTMEIGVVNGKCNIVSYDNGSNIGWITDSLQTPVGGVYVTEMLGRMVMCVRT